MAKINISIDDELLRRIDDYADSAYQSRSGLIALACSQLLDQRDAMKAMAKLPDLIKSYANGDLTDDEKKKLEVLETLSASMSL